MEAFLQGPFGYVSLGLSVVTIGRALDNLLVINNPASSSYHAIIRPEGDRYCLIDLGSTNGTFVKEQRLTPNFPFALQKGDRIRIGDMTFLYETGRPNSQAPFALHIGQTNTPTAKVPAIGYNAFNQSEQFGEQPPAPYPNSTLVQPVSPGFEQPHFSSLSTHNPYGMNATSQPQPFQSSFPPPLTTHNPYGMNATSQPQPFQPGSMSQPPAQRKKSNTGIKVLLISLSIILVLGTAGTGIAAYMLTRPKPVMTITSTYHVSSMPAGSTSTVLHIAATNFSGSSAITFLLDNQPVASNQHVTSDANGSVKTDLMITSDWALGNHTLTATDASGYITKVGSRVAIVEQGQAHTPGPNGAPPDDMVFNLNLHIQFQDAGTGKQLGTLSDNLAVTGKPGPSGGTVCQYYDDGDKHIYTGTDKYNDAYTETYSTTCTGTYKGGKLTYTQTVTSDKIVYTDGVTCIALTPYTSQHLEGAFTNSHLISGTYSSDSFTWNCDKGIGSQLEDASKGSWSAPF
jgi:hypothetical protein